MTSKEATSEETVSFTTEEGIKSCFMLKVYYTEVSAKTAAEKLGTRSGKKFHSYKCSCNLWHAVSSEEE